MPVTLPPDIPYLATETERLAREFCSCDFVFMERLLRNLTRHESRFAAARWLESVGRPGWRFLDGPGPLTPKQSARVLHEACLRARDGGWAIVGVLAPWEPRNSGSMRRVSVLPYPSVVEVIARKSCWYTNCLPPAWGQEPISLRCGDDLDVGIDRNREAADAAVFVKGWICL